MVNLGGNVSETVDLSARDSVIGVLENMVHATKNDRKASLRYVLNQENIFKAFSFLIPSANRISWQKTTWATIMSRNDKTCIILHFLTNKHFHLSAQSSFKCSYYSVSESKKISDISNPMLLGHLDMWNCPGVTILQLLAFSIEYWIYSSSRSETSVPSPRSSTTSSSCLQIPFFLSDIIQDILLEHS